MNKLTVEELQRQGYGYLEIVEFCWKVAEDTRKHTDEKIRRFFELLGVIAVLIAIAILLREYGYE